MNLTLLFKELKSLRFCAYLALALSAFEFVYVLVSDFPDRQVEIEIDITGIIAIKVFFGLIIGVSILSQERTQQTQSFMDALPVTRWEVYFSKTLAAVLMMAIVLGVTSVPSFLFFAWSKTSCSEPTSWFGVTGVLGLSLLLGVAVVTVAMLLSFTRQWFPLVAGLVLWAFVWLRQSGVHWGAWLNTQNLLDVKGIEEWRQLPWRAMVGHSALASLGFLGAGIAFQWRDGSLSRWLERVASWRFAGWITVLTRLVAVIVWLSVIREMAKNDGSGDDLPPVSMAAGRVDHKKLKDGAETPEVVSFASHSTRHYELVFRESQRKRLMPLFERFDAVHDQVTDFFQQPDPMGARIVVDVASSVSCHAAGQTNWTKIRVPLSLSQDDDRFIQVLRHETGHVYIEQLSAGQAASRFNAMRAFHEGVATAVELEPEDEITLKQRLKMERWAVMTDSRGRVSLALLCDDAAMTRVREPFIVYPLGYVFARSLEDVGGDSLPRRILESLRDHPPLPRASSTEHWQHVLQRCGTSFDQVMAAYDERLNQLRTREKDYLSKFPRLEGKVSVEGDEIVIRGPEVSNVPESAKMVCQVEQDLGLTQLPMNVPIQSDGTFRIQRSGQSNNRIRYLLGWADNAGTYPFFEPWAETVLD